MTILILFVLSNNFDENLKLVENTDLENVQVVLDLREKLLFRFLTGRYIRYSLFDEGKSPFLRSYLGVIFDNLDENQKLSKDIDFDACLTTLHLTEGALCELLDLTHLGVFLTNGNDLQFLRLYSKYLSDEPH
jgi:hypothetical protein